MIGVLEQERREAELAVEPMSEGEAAVRVGQALLMARTGKPAGWSEAMVQVIEALKDVIAFRLVGGPPAALARALAARLSR